MALTHPLLITASSFPPSLLVHQSPDILLGNRPNKWVNYTQLSCFGSSSRFGHLAFYRLRPQNKTFLYMLVPLPTLQYWDTLVRALELGTLMNKLCHQSPWSIKVSGNLKTLVSTKRNRNLKCRERRWYRIFLFDCIINGWIPNTVLDLIYWSYLIITKGW